MPQTRKAPRVRPSVATKAKPKAPKVIPVQERKPQVMVFGGRYFDAIWKKWMVLTVDGPKPCEAPRA